MLYREFLNNCVACGGNWCLMILSGIEKLFPNSYYEAKKLYDTNKNDVLLFANLIDIIKRNGVIIK